MDTVSIVEAINAMIEITLAYNKLLFGITMLMIFSVVLAIISITIFIMWIFDKLKAERYIPKDQLQTQQDSNVQQTDNKNISINFEAYRNIADSIGFGLVAFVVIAAIAFVTLVASSPDAVGYRTAAGFIFIFALLGIVAMIYGSKALDKAKPKKVKKIVKETIIYENGETVEREKRYEY